MAVIEQGVWRITTEQGLGELRKIHNLVTDTKTRRQSEHGM